MTKKVGDNVDKTVGIVAYITLIGFIIAIVMNSEKKGEEKKFGAFHLRQSLGIIIAAIAVMIGLAILVAILSAISWTLGATLGGILYPVTYLGILALVIIGIINAANGEEKPLPVVGPYIQKILGKTFE
ncbi:MAG: DUF4870 domain-containing protein [Bacteroidota bacterium]